MRRLFVFFAAVTGLLSPVFADAIIRVAPARGDSSVDGDGLSWESPYYSIANAVREVANLGGGSVLLKKGFMKFRLPLFRKVMFQLWVALAVMNWVFCLKAM